MLIIHLRTRKKKNEHRKRKKNEQSLRPKTSAKTSSDKKIYA